METTERNTYGIELDATYIGEREEDGWKHFLWTVTLTKDDRVRDLPFRLGRGYIQTKCGKRIKTRGRYRTMPCTHVRCESAGPQPAPPDLYSVLCALKADATRGESFKEWAEGFGYDTDSITVQRMYFECQASESESRRLFGSDWQAILEDEDYV